MSTASIAASRKRIARREAFEQELEQAHKARQDDAIHLMQEAENR